MCERCVEIFEEYPEEIRILLENKRTQMVLLAAEIGNAIGKTITYTEMPEGLSKEEVKAYEEEKARHLPWISLISAVAYAATAENHSASLAQGLAIGGSIATDIGYFKSGAEQVTRSVN